MRAWRIIPTGAFDIPALESWLEQWEPQAVQLLGPAPAGVAKVNNRYRYRLTLMCKNTRKVREMVAWLLRRAMEDRENRGVSVSADINPMD